MSLSISNENISFNPNISNNDEVQETKSLSGNVSKNIQKFESFLMEFKDARLQEVVDSRASSPDKVLPPQRKKRKRRMFASAASLILDSEYQEIYPPPRKHRKSTSSLQETTERKMSSENYSPVRPKRLEKVYSDIKLDEISSSVPTLVVNDCKSNQIEKPPRQKWIQDNLVTSTPVDETDKTKIKLLKPERKRKLFGSGNSLDENGVKTLAVPKITGILQHHDVNDNSTKDKSHHAIFASPMISDVKVRDEIANIRPQRASVCILDSDFLNQPHIKHVTNLRKAHSIAGLTYHERKNPSNLNVRQMLKKKKRLRRVRKRVRRMFSLKDKANPCWPKKFKRKKKKANSNLELYWNRSSSEIRSTQSEESFASIFLSDQKINKKVSVEGMTEEPPSFLFSSNPQENIVFPDHVKSPRLSERRNGPMTLREKLLKPRYLLSSGSTSSLDSVALRKAFAFLEKTIRKTSSGSDAAASEVRLEEKQGSAIEKSINQKDTINGQDTLDGSKDSLKSLTRAFSQNDEEPTKYRTKMSLKTKFFMKATSVPDIAPRIMKAFSKSDSIVEVENHGNEIVPQNEEQSPSSGHFTTNRISLHSMISANTIDETDEDLDDYSIYNEEKLTHSNEIGFVGNLSDCSIPRSISPILEASKKKRKIGMVNIETVVRIESNRNLVSSENESSTEKINSEEVIDSKQNLNQDTIPGVIHSDITDEKLILPPFQNDDLPEKLDDGMKVLESKEVDDLIDSEAVGIHSSKSTSDLEKSDVDSRYDNIKIVGVVEKSSVKLSPQLKKEIINNEVRKRFRSLSTDEIDSEYDEFSACDKISTDNDLGTAGRHHQYKSDPVEFDEFVDCGSSEDLRSNRYNASENSESSLNTQKYSCEHRNDSLTANDNKSESKDHDAPENRIDNGINTITDHYEMNNNKVFDSERPESNQKLCSIEPPKIVISLCEEENCDKDCCAQDLPGSKNSSDESNNNVATESVEKTENMIKINIDEPKKDLCNDQMYSSHTKIDTDSNLDSRTENNGTQPDDFFEINNYELQSNSCDLNLEKHFVESDQIKCIKELAKEIVEGSNTKVDDGLLDESTTNLDIRQVEYSTLMNLNNDTVGSELSSKMFTDVNPNVIEEEDESKAKSEKIVIEKDSVDSTIDICDNLDNGLDIKLEEDSQLDGKNPIYIDPKKSKNDQMVVNGHVEEFEMNLVNSQEIKSEKCQIEEFGIKTENDKSEDSDLISEKGQREGSDIKSKNTVIEGSGIRSEICQIDLSGIKSECSQIEDSEISSENCQTEDSGIKSENGKLEYCGIKLGIDHFENSDVESANKEDSEIIPIPDNIKYKRDSVIDDILKESCPKLCNDFVSTDDDEADYFITERCVDTGLLEYNRTYGKFDREAWRKQFSKNAVKEDKKLVHFLKKQQNKVKKRLTKILSKKEDPPNVSSVEKKPMSLAVDLGDLWADIERSGSERSSKKSTIESSSDDGDYLFPAVTVDSSDNNDDILSPEKLHQEINKEYRNCTMKLEVRAYSPLLKFSDRRRIRANSIQESEFEQDCEDDYEGRFSDIRKQILNGLHMKEELKNKGAQRKRSSSLSPLHHFTNDIRPKSFLEYDESDDFFEHFRNRAEEENYAHILNSDDDNGKESVKDDFSNSLNCYSGSIAKNEPKTLPSKFFVETGSFARIPNKTRRGSLHGDVDIARYIDDNDVLGCFTDEPIAVSPVHTDRCHKDGKLSKHLLKIPSTDNIWEEKILPSDDDDELVHENVTSQLKLVENSEEKDGIADDLKLVTEESIVNTDYCKQSKKELDICSNNMVDNSNNDTEFTVEVVSESEEPKSRKAIENEEQSNKLDVCLHKPIDKSIENISVVGTPVAIESEKEIDDYEKLRRLGICPHKLFAYPKGIFEIIKELRPVVFESEKDIGEHEMLKSLGICPHKVYETHEDKIGIIKQILSDDATVCEIPSESFGSDIQKEDLQVVKETETRMDNKEKPRKDNMFPTVEDNVQKNDIKSSGSEKYKDEYDQLIRLGICPHKVFSKSFGNVDMSNVDNSISYMAYDLKTIDHKQQKPDSLVECQAVGIILNDENSPNELNSKLEAVSVIENSSDLQIELKCDSNSLGEQEQQEILPGTENVTSPHKLVENSDENEKITDDLKLVVEESIDTTGYCKQSKKELDICSNEMVDNSNDDIEISDEVISVSEEPKYEKEDNVDSVVLGMFAHKLNEDIFQNDGNSETEESKEDIKNEEKSNEFGIFSHKLIEKSMENISEKCTPVVLESKNGVDDYEEEQLRKLGVCPHTLFAYPKGILEIIKELRPVDFESRRDIGEDEMLKSLGICPHKSYETIEDKIGVIKQILSDNANAYEIPSEFGAPEVQKEDLQIEKENEIRMNNNTKPREDNIFPTGEDNVQKNNVKSSGSEKYKDEYDQLIRLGICPHKVFSKSFGNADMNYVDNSISYMAYDGKSIDNNQQKLDSLVEYQAVGIILNDENSPNELNSKLEAVSVIENSSDLQIELKCDSNSLGEQEQQEILPGTENVTSPHKLVENSDENEKITDDLKLVVEESIDTTEYCKQSKKELDICSNEMVDNSNDDIEFTDEVISVSEEPKYEKEDNVDSVVLGMFAHKLNEDIFQNDGNSETEESKEDIENEEKSNEFAIFPHKLIEKSMQNIREKCTPVVLESKNGVDDYEEEQLRRLGVCPHKLFAYPKGILEIIKELRPVAVESERDIGEDEMLKSLGICPHKSYETNEDKIEVIKQILSDNANAYEIPSESGAPEVQNKDLRIEKENEIRMNNNTKPREDNIFSTGEDNVQKNDVKSSGSEKYKDEYDQLIRLGICPHKVFSKSFGNADMNYVDNSISYMAYDGKSIVNNQQKPDSLVECQAVGIILNVENSPNKLNSKLEAVSVIENSSDLQIELKCNSNSLGEQEQQEILLGTENVTSPHKQVENSDENDVIAYDMKLVAEESVDTTDYCKQSKKEMDICSNNIVDNSNDDFEFTDEVISVSEEPKYEKEDNVDSVVLGMFAHKLTEDIFQNDGNTETEESKEDIENEEKSNELTIFSHKLIEKSMENISEKGTPVVLESKNGIDDYEEEQLRRLGVCPHTLFAYPKGILEIIKELRPVAVESERDIEEHEMLKSLGICPHKTYETNEDKIGVIKQILSDNANFCEIPSESFGSEVQKEDLRIEEETRLRINNKKKPKKDNIFPTVEDSVQKIVKSSGSEKYKDEYDQLIRLGICPHKIFSRSFGNTDMNNIDNSTSRIAHDFKSVDHKQQMPDSLVECQAVGSILHVENSPSELNSKLETGSAVENSPELQIESKFISNSLGEQEQSRDESFTTQTTDISIEINCQSNSINSPVDTTINLNELTSIKTHSTTFEKCNSYVPKLQCTNLQKMSASNENIKEYGEPITTTIRSPNRLFTVMRVHSLSLNDLRVEPDDVQIRMNARRSSDFAISDRKVNSFEKSKSVNPSKEFNQFNSSERETHASCGHLNGKSEYLSPKPLRVAQLKETSVRSLIAPQQLSKCTECIKIFDRLSENDLDTKSDNTDIESSSDDETDSNIVDVSDTLKQVCSRLSLQPLEPRVTLRTWCQRQGSTEDLPFRDSTEMIQSIVEKFEKSTAIPRCDSLPNLRRFNDTPSSGTPVDHFKDDPSSDYHHQSEYRVQKDRSIDVYPETLRQRQRSMAPSPTKVDIKNWNSNTPPVRESSSSPSNKYLPSVKALRSQFESGKTLNGSISPTPSTRSNSSTNSSKSGKTHESNPVQNISTRHNDTSPISRRRISGSSLASSSLEKTSSVNSLNSAQSSENLLDGEEDLHLEEHVEPIFCQFQKVDQELRDLMSKSNSTAGWDPKRLLKSLYYVPESPSVHKKGHSYVNIEGYLDKLPSGRKKATFWNAWKKRYFVAKEGVLYYYQNSQCDKVNLRLTLMGGRVETMEGNMVGVDDGKGHYVVVRCATKQEAEKWRKALETHLVEDFASQYIQPSPYPSNPNQFRRTIIVDIGSCSTRAGILASCATLPQLFFPSVCASGRQTKKQLWGYEALSPSTRSSSSLSFPIRPTNKISKFSLDLNAVSGLLLKVFSDLKVDPQQYNLQISVPRMLTQTTQAELLRILIDKFGVKGVNVTHQSVLALYAYNATSGIVVDIGERIDVVPIIDGYIVDGGVSRVPYGGHKIVDHLRQFLHMRNVSLVNDVETLIIRQVLESVCYTALHYNTEKARCTNSPDSFEKTVSLSDYFPDKTTCPYESVELDFGRFQATEGLFNPDAWGLDNAGVHKLVHKAIQECSMDIRREMSRSIFLAGGVTQLRGFSERLTTEVDNLTPPAIRPKVHASPYRYHASYIGGCTLAESEAFNQSVISREEWRKLGTSALKRWHL